MAKDQNLEVCGRVSYISQSLKASLLHEKYNSLRKVHHLKMHSTFWASWKARSHLFCAFLELSLPNSSQRLRNHNVQLFLLGFRMTLQQSFALRTAITYQHACVKKLAKCTPWLIQQRNVRRHYQRNRRKE